MSDDTLRPLCAELASELAHGVAKADVVARLVARGWSAGNAAHFVDYLEAANTLANSLYPPDSTDFGDDSPRWRATSPIRRGFLAGLLNAIARL